MENRFSGPLAELNFTKEYSAEEAKVLANGLQPNSMDDKWVVVYKNNELCLYRSWTGLGVFKVLFNPTANGGLAVEKAYVLEETLNSATPEWCRKLLNAVIDRVILGYAAEFPGNPTATNNT